MEVQPWNLKNHFIKQKSSEIIQFFMVLFMVFFMIFMDKTSGIFTHVQAVASLTELSKQWLETNCATCGLLLNMAIEIVDLPNKNSDLPNKHSDLPNKISDLPKKNSDLL